MTRRSPFGEHPALAAEPVLKVLKSAGANAENNPKHSIATRDLKVAEAFADCGPVLKRMMPRARGSANRILKRTSHITVVLDALDSKPVAAKKEVRKEAPAKVEKPAVKKTETAAGAPAKKAAAAKKTEAKADGGKN